jgi:TIR domain-containing protein
MPVSHPSNRPGIIFITHAAPEDNQFALWLSSKLAMAGYRVWVDRNRLRGGHDFWDEIERVLREEAVKQVVVFTQHIRKPGVKKELALGEVMKRKLGDPNFMIGIRNDESDFGDAPPELLRSNILDAFPNWHDCLKELLDALDQYGVPRDASPDARLLTSIVEAREDGRRFVIPTPEAALTNWFPIEPPPRIRYFRFDGLQNHMQAWRRECRVPHVDQGRLTGTFLDRDAFLAASSFEVTMTEAYDLPFKEFVDGSMIGPYGDRQSARKDIANLLRQHFDKAASDRGLLPFEFANGDTGWFFPDGLVPGNKVVCQAPDGRRIRRSVSGRFKALRWHLCLVAKPRIWPSLVYRLHANIVLSMDGRTPMPGEKTHSRRRRLTRSWWNDVWRDRLLAGMSFLAGGADALIVCVGEASFRVSTWPLLAELPVSYEAIDQPLPSEEDEEGNIVPNADLDDRSDDLDEAADAGGAREAGEAS